MAVFLCVLIAGRLLFEGATPGIVFTEESLC